MGIKRKIKIAKTAVSVSIFAYGLYKEHEKRKTYKKYPRIGYNFNR